VQTLFNSLVDAVARDEQYLEATLSAAARWGGTRACISGGRGGRADQGTCSLAVPQHCQEEAAGLGSEVNCAHRTGSTDTPQSTLHAILSNYVEGEVG
jgi:hypothetical protein